MTIFLSYSTEDLSAKNRIRTRLWSESLPVWEDSRRIRGGDRLDRILESALRGSGVFMLLWSQSAERSRWVRDELFYFRDIEDACAADRMVLPIRLDATPLPLACSGLRYFWSDRGILAPADWDEILESIRRNSLVI